MADEAWAARVSAIAALDEPTRRRLYEFVVDHPAPVSRDDAADAVGAPRTTVAFHLDKLVAEGLLEVVYERRTGRSGPGAGRPAKLYRRSAAQIAVSLPERRYELAARLLADACQESETSGEPVRAVLGRLARDLGRDLGAAARATGTGTAVAALRSMGFAPREEETAVVLGNCPFRSLAQRHAELVCGMNLCLVGGILDGLAATGCTARLAPRPDHCCVRVDQSAPA
ncbi:helix-turn-helix transcriptional regulator [Actinokineospora iranica]|uniref:Predicted transcriptional regulator, ArsR family n=1 Tax=Actinokineospora iranica TaxID=1271860 RepID=A0A1G6XQU4_9PSEU|nr:helix-turn-helix domain-containing protein [Actinokineospora iranica]SDD79696.1 Predicted transcriptional regulator, ArsR family [Actinokineospora iranica]